MVDVRLDTIGPWPAALVRVGDAWVSVHSRRDPVAEADRMLTRHYSGTLPRTIAVAGLGLGFLLDALEQRHFTGRVVAAEPLPALADALRERAVAQAWMAAGRLALVTAPAFEGSAELWKTFDDPTADASVLVHPVLARTCPVESSGAQSVLERAQFAARANAEAKRENAGRYLLNTLRNAPAIAAEGDAAALTGSFCGVPALLVAAGPSLDRNLPDIIRYQDRALIVAVDTALRPLLGAGIRPQLVVAVDPTDSNARHLADLPPCPETYLVAEGSLDPEALTHFAHRTFFFRVGDHDPWPWLREQGVDAGRLRAWGSVLTTAFDLALSMGCDPIVFAGADLGFTGDRPYARGVTFEEDWQRMVDWGQSLSDLWHRAIDARAIVPENDVHGALVRTAPHLIAFRDWIVREAAEHRGRRIVNATNGGILRGAGIVTAAIGDCLGHLPSRDGLPARVNAVHRARAVSPDLARAIDDLRAQLPNAAMDPPFDAWLRFAGPRVSDADLRCALAGPPRDRETAPVVQGGEATLRPASPPGTNDPDPASAAAVAARLATVDFELPPDRLHVDASGAVYFLFRSSAARLWSAVTYGADLVVCEDGVPLDRAEDSLAVKNRGRDAYWSWRDEIWFAARDGSSPRVNGRRYTIRVPPFIAHLERLPLDTILRERL